MTDDQDDEPMTVARLREELAGMPDHAEIRIDDADATGKVVDVYLAESRTFDIDAGARIVWSEPFPVVVISSAADD